MIQQFHFTHRRDVTDTNTPDQSGPEGNGNKGVLHNPQTPVLASYHQMKFNVLPRTQKYVDLSTEHTM